MYNKEPLKLTEPLLKTTGLDGTKPTSKLVGEIEIEL